MVPERFWGPDIIGHVTIRLVICGFLLAFNLNRLGYLARFLTILSVKDFWYIEPQRYWGWWPWLFGATWRRWSHSIGLIIYGFLWVVLCNHHSSLITDCSSSRTFKQYLKTFLFSLSFWAHNSTLFYDCVKRPSSSLCRLRRFKIVHNITLSRTIAMANT